MTWLFLDFNFLIYCQKCHCEALGCAIVCRVGMILFGSLVYLCGYSSLSLSLLFLPIYLLYQFLTKLLENLILWTRSLVAPSWYFPAIWRTLLVLSIQYHFQTRQRQKKNKTESQTQPLKLWLWLLPLGTAVEPELHSPVTLYVLIRDASASPKCTIRQSEASHLEQWRSAKNKNFKMQLRPKGL